jgi:hypothetical protein
MSGVAVPGLHAADSPRRRRKGASSSARPAGDDALEAVLTEKLIRCARSIDGADRGVRLLPGGHAPDREGERDRPQRERGLVVDPFRGGPARYLMQERSWRIGTEHRETGGLGFPGTTPVRHSPHAMECFI